MTNNSRTYECFTKFCPYVTTDRVFQIAVRGKWYSPQWGEWEILLGQNSSLSSLRLKMNICILKLSAPFSKDLLYLYYIQVIRFWFFWRKIDLSHIFHCFISPWICPWFHDVSYMINNSSFSKNRESYFHKPI